MATIDKKLIHFNRLADFEARLAAGDIRDYSIVCIKDAKLIWTHGEYYGDLSECLKVTQQTLTDEEKRQVQENLGYYFLEWDGVSTTIQLADEEYEKLKNATEVVLSNMGLFLFPVVYIQDYTVQYQYSLGDQITIISLSVFENPITIELLEIPIPTATSQLENDSDFVSAVDTGTEVDGVDVTYVTEAAMNAALSGKQDEIADIASIREGANKGATALQEEQYKGTVTSITAGEGLTGGTITESGTIALEESGVTAKKYPSNTASWTTDTFVDGSAYDVKRIINMTGNITVDKYGRITNATLYNNGVNIYYPKPATTSLNGLMTASDKTKLDGIDMSTKQDKIEVVNHGTSDTTFTLTPNVYHKWGEVSSLSFTFVMGEPNEYNEYMFEFVSGATATTLTLPDTVSWFTTPSIEANKVYQVSIVNNVGLIVGV